MNKLYKKSTAVFNCKDIPSRDIPGLGGTAFEVIKLTAANSSSCVWGGPTCLFNDMVDVIDEKAQNEQTAVYRFGGTGLLTENAERTRPHVFPSKSLFTEDW